MLLIPSVALALAFSTSMGQPADLGQQPAIAHAAASPDEAVPRSLAESPLADFRVTLLELAFDAASALPTHPHAKNRCRLQEAIVVTCLELKQPRRALSYTEKIDNWRRGSLYADLAQYVQRAGDAQLADQYLDLADRVAEHRGDPNAQEWPAERIKAKIADVLMERTPATKPKDFDEQLGALDAVVAHGGFEETRAAMEAYSTLFDEHYGDESRRATLLDRVRATRPKVPLQISFEVTLELADCAAAHSDAQQASRLIEEARGFIDALELTAADRIPLLTRLARTLRRTGSDAGARRELGRALSLYDTESTHIVDIYRSGCLRTLAEGYHDSGDKGAALELYRRAVECGVINPNSRPRTDDLVAVCCSLARNAVDPGEALMKRLREIRAGLGEPW